MAHSSAFWRRWADIVIIAASAYCIAAATQVPLELATGDVDTAVRFQLWLPVAYVLAGVAGMASVFVAGRWPGVSKACVVLAVMLLISGFLALERLALLPVLSLGIPAVGMLVALPFMGPMPGPAEEAAEERAVRRRPPRD
jgi:hypothetical protein